MSTATSKIAKSTEASKSETASSKTKGSPGKSAVTAQTSVLDGSAPATAKQAQPTIADAPQPVILGPMMRKKELTDTVVLRSGLKKKDVKPVVEMVLNVLGEALGDNRELNLPPFGRLKIRREKKLPNGRMVVAKIRQSTPSEKGAQNDAPESYDSSDV